MTATEIPVDNGVNVEALLGVRNALGDTPEIAQFQWRSTVRVLCLRSAPVSRSCSWSGVTSENRSGSYSHS